jgi:pSer/pThr/pTyr-binding forkhead associated (FHA) protein
VLVLPDGRSQELNAPVIIGRAPSVSNVPASVLPHLITLSADDISRNHVRIAVEGGTVVVTDLLSSNGTQVIQPGKPPLSLRGGEPTPVIVGTIVDLGSGITLTIAEA